MPDGSSWLASVERGAFRLGGARSSAALHGGWGAPIGIDPTGQTAWAGGRCYFHFRVLTPQGPAYWTPSSHDWPCGHGKKLYGFKDNDPLSVALAVDASTCLSTYEHDTLLTPGLPLRWRDMGEFALAERARGEPRALLFWRADGDEGFPGDPFEADEDARDGFVVATLGPSPSIRYTVSLEKPTYRLIAHHVERLGGPDEGWIVCNDRHEIVRRASGRLLGSSPAKQPAPNPTPTAAPPPAPTQSAAVSPPPVVAEPAPVVVPEPPPAIEEKPPAPAPIDEAQISRERARAAILLLENVSTSIRAAVCSARALLEQVPEAYRQEPLVVEAHKKVRAKEPAALKEEVAEFEENRMYLCRDGTSSPTCRCGGPKRGCCSHHQGVAGCEPLPTEFTCP